MIRTPSGLRGALFLCAALALSCSSEPARVDTTLTVEAAALSLEGVGDVVWDIEVAAADGVVWQKRVTSSRFGNGLGSASYVGPCDASAGQHTVKLWVVGLYASPVTDPGQFSSGAATGVVGAPLAFENPTTMGPLTRSATCVASGDVPVTFDVALMRAADQGFFDIAVSFDDIFCSAKLDCDAGDLLFDENDQRAATMVLGFACTASSGDETQTVLYLDDLYLDCSTPSADDFAPDLIVGLGGPVGNQCSAGATDECFAVTELGGTDASDYLFQIGVYRGTQSAETARAVYWNVALGVTDAIDGCRLRTRGTAAPLAGNAAVNNGTILEGAIYPYIDWDVDLGTCGNEVLTLGDPNAAVRALYPSMAPNGGPSAAMRFRFGFGVGFAIGAFCDECDQPPTDCFEPIGTCAADGSGCHYEPRTLGATCSDDGATCTTDRCDGSGACLHVPGNGGVACRPVAGPCDLVEVCDGTSASCPPDLVVAAGVACRVAEDLCDVPERCDGTNASCPAPSVSECALCGPAAGQSSVLAPDLGLCSVGDPSGVVGSGPFAWDCDGVGGGPDASCLSDRSCDATTLSWAACASAVGVEAHGYDATVANTNGGWVGSARAVCTQGAWATSETSCVEIIAGRCGAADGDSTLDVPIGDLCESGAASAVDGQGPFTWSCVGQGGGGDSACASDRSCDAALLGWGGCASPVAGAAHGSDVLLPNEVAGWIGDASASCAQGTWQLSGASCIEIIEAACGSADGTSVVDAPSDGLCAAGFASAVDGQGPFTWTCSGQGGGADVPCSADRSCDADALVWGSCGADVDETPDGDVVELGNANEGFVGAAEATCAQGEWQVDVADAICIMTIDAACGSADGGSSASVPSAGLCASGSASAVVGAGPFTWSCRGQGDGGDASCTSNKSCAAETIEWSQCAAAVDAAAHGDSATLGNANAGYVGGASATCVQGAWMTSDLSCVEIIVGACGVADGGSSAGTPSAGLCASGAATAVSGSGPFAWQCLGQGGGSTASCASHKSCGAESVSWQTSCSGAQSAETHGYSGALTNSASGWQGSATATCSEGVWSTSASSCIETISGACGAAHNGSSASAPSAGLCASGAATAVSGSGPFDWQCVGQGGGTTARCTAHKSCASETLTWQSTCSASQVAQAHAYSGALANSAVGWQGAATASCTEGVWSTSATSCIETISGACGAADGGSSASAPSTALCASGTPTAVTGSGPFNWQCSGQGGGSTASCASNKSCGAQTINWETNCSAAQSAEVHGFSANIGNSAGGYVGGATATCVQGTWTTSSTSCVQTIDAVCGSADGQSFATTPASNLCAAGTSSGVAGSGPYSWSCIGQGGGSSVACSAHRSCATQSLSWQTSCSASQASQAHAYSGALANSAVGWQGSATATCSEGTWSTSATTCVQTIAGACGAADGGSSASAPSTGLCASGTPTAVTGSGPYAWQCSGQGGGSTASCTAHKSCGAQSLTWETSCSAAQTSQAHAYSGGLTNSAVGWQGSATATCSEGTWSTSATSCVQTISGVCGSANNGSTASAPVANLCTTGTPTSVTGSGPYAWQCTGQGGGTTASCGSNKSCGAQTITWQTSCSASQPSQAHGYSGAITNTAIGYQGSGSASCTQGTWSTSGTSCVQTINGACGASDGQSFTSTPSSGLCTNGTPTTVSGSGPFAWQCTGQGGGTTASCSAHKTCGTQTLAWQTNCSASQSTQSHGYSASLANTAGGYQGSATATCSEGVWDTSATSCIQTISGACGASNNGSTAAAPSTGLCTSGTPTTVSGSGPFSWQCTGQGGGTTASCSSNKSCATQALSWQTNCSASQSAQSHAYSQSLANTAGGYQGSATATCTQGTWSTSATSCVQTISGVCGSSDQGSFSAPPATNLCSAGTPTTVSGSGPYTWQCTGQGGGSTSSCTAHKTCATQTLSWQTSCSASQSTQAHAYSGALTNTAGGYQGSATATCSEGVWGTSATSCVQTISGTCGAANNGSTTTAPASGLCTTGTPTSVTGSGPWAWQCTGQGGGSTASCGSNKTCATQTLSWNTSCSASQTSQAHAYSGSLTNTAGGFQGSATATCTQGVWSTSSTSCVQTINGACGTANGGSSASAPSANLCSAGSQSAVSGSGPFTWTCTGQGGGTTANCSSNKSCALQTLTWNTSCSASQSAQSHGYSASLANTAGGFQGSATATCSQGTWSTSSTSCVQTINGACGAANGGSTTSAPASSLCNAGSNTAVSGSGPYTWSCVGQGGGSTAGCSSNRSCVTTSLAWSSCGASQSGQSHGYSGGLSNTNGGFTGSATATCSQGGWGLTGTSCTAVINGACGASNGGNFTSAPSSGLCNAGSASGVSGSGPYTWSCTGSGGGSTASCSANRQCAAQTHTWSTYCSAASATQNTGYSGTLTSSSPSGSVTLSCTQGAWGYTSPTCSQVCTPGDVQNCAPCSPCGEIKHRTCQANGTWGACTGFCRTSGPCP